MPVIMGTAGHIDHGKTTLVKALTGIDCDRLAEEKKRGITIELGFAFLDLGPERRLSIVDVPGHEKFVKNMVAGATGVDFVMLVIAADEGVMPQTREHLEICSLLGVSTGLVALTKTDMVEPDFVDLAAEDVGDLLKGTFLENAPIIPVSARTGEGIDQLKAEIVRIMDAFVPKRRSDLARLPVDRVFVMKGHGTVVTGTLVSGKLKLGEDAQLFPSGKTTKIRGLQSHGATVEEAPAGRRTAVNLPGLEVADIKRGEILARPGSLFPHEFWDVELACLPSCRKPLKHRTELHLHHGSSETLAKLLLFDRETLKPGETALCRVRFDSPRPGVYGDRIVLRSFSPLRTVAGGRIVSPYGRKLKRKDDKTQRALAAFASGDPEALIAAQLELAGPAGLRFPELAVMSDLETKALEALLAAMLGKQAALLFDKEARLYASGAVAASLSTAALARLAEFHKEKPMLMGLGRGELAAAFGRETPGKLGHLLVERMLKRGEIVQEQEFLRLPDHRPSMGERESSLSDAVLELYVKGGPTPPMIREVLEALSTTQKELAPVLKSLVDRGLLTRLKEDLYYATAALDAVREKVTAHLRERGEITPAEMRDVAGLSRKFSVPVLEQFDKEKTTIRVGDARKLRR